MQKDAARSVSPEALLGILILSAACVVFLLGDTLAERGEKNISVTVKELESCF